jgi:hypothetical protein
MVYILRSHTLSISNLISSATNSVFGCSCMNSGVNSEVNPILGNLVCCESDKLPLFYTIEIVKKRNLMYFLRNVNDCTGHNNSLQYPTFPYHDMFDSFNSI